MVNVIQDFFFNNLNNEKANELYFKITKGTTLKQENSYFLFKGGVFSTDTYFNSLPLKFLLSKTMIKHIGLHAHIEGKILLRFILMKENCKKVYAEYKFDNGINEILWIENIEQEESYDLMYVEVVALDDSIIKNLNWVTDARKRKNINLAICCTTFNRQQEVKKLYDRLSSKNYLTNKCKLFIINNGTPIDVPDTEFCKVIKNKNTGGTGGFMRGVLEARKSGQFTHVMFIDDDAFCEPLSIKKSISILEYAIDDNASIAGAMLFLDRPWIQYEAGATLKNFNIQSNNPNLDLRKSDSLLINANSTECTYGPWWFFIFPILDDLKMSFPFFVRGDDVTFSLRNNFKPFILNGVCSWQESFDAKISPTVEYLAFRSFVMISLVYLNQKPSNKVLFKSIFSQIMREICGYRYQIGFALCQSLKDILSGPEFWENHIEMGSYMKALSSLSGKMESHNVTNLPSIDIEPLVSRKRKLFAVITLFGNLLPSFLCRGGKTVLGLAPRPFVALGHNHIWQYSPEHKAIYIFRRNPKQFFKLCFEAFKLTLLIILRRSTLESKYEKSLSTFESMKFWEEALK
jgi:galactofuranosylgalactofuranosylrhamnosyl-N-acetylglucosaminyl-diphospho-decaprenol beta-1,5/1,6-galactofuranosyltransferase